MKPKCRVRGGFDFYWPGKCQCGCEAVLAEAYNRLVDDPAGELARRYEQHHPWMGYAAKSPFATSEIEAEDIKP